MTELDLHRLLAWAMLGVAAVTFWYLFRRTAPYGRHHAGSGWGSDISSKVGWVVMEWPAVLFFLSVYLQGEAAANVVPLLFMTMWQAHYVDRTFIYPFRTRSAGYTPLVVVVVGLAFNLVNPYINARLISELGAYGVSWLSDPRFVICMTVFAFEMILNVHSDNILLRLRKYRMTQYGIPHRGAFRYVSCPNYLGEIVEWTGRAIATGSLAGLSFAAFTFANLARRAINNHRWYRGASWTTRRSGTRLSPGCGERKPVSERECRARACEQDGATRSRHGGGIGRRLAVPNEQEVRATSTRIRYNDTDRHVSQSGGTSTEANGVWATKSM